MDDGDASFGVAGLSVKCVCETVTHPVIVLSDSDGTPPSQSASNESDMADASRIDPEYGMSLTQYVKCQFGVLGIESAYVVMVNHGGRFVGGRLVVSTSARQIPTRCGRYNSRDGSDRWRGCGHTGRGGSGGRAG